MVSLDQGVLRCRHILNQFFSGKEHPKVVKDIIIFWTMGKGREELLRLIIKPYLKKMLV
jgi:hypothetical protein